MKFCSVTTPPVSKATPSLVKTGLVVLMFLPASIVVADTTPNTTAPAAAKPETTATNPVKPVPVVKSVGSAPLVKPINPTQAAKSAPAVSPKLKPASPECVRTGQRVIAALARDDSGAASQFHTFYTAFKCSPPLLAQAFGCLVNFQAANPGTNPTQEQVTQCWEEPTMIPKVQPQTGSDGSGEKPH